jgi:hypothetical protein
MNSIIPTKVAFDYNVVTEDFQGTLIAAADRIKARERRAVTDIIEIGRELSAIKAELEHGVFLKWVAAEFQWSARSAQNYMAAAEWAGDKYETVAYLPPKLIYDLASKTTPYEIKAEVRANLDAGKPVDVEEIKARISDARAHQRTADTEENRRRKRDRGKPASESARLRRQQEEQKQREEAERREAEQKAQAAEIVAILRKLPEQDFERLMELLTTASLWVVQGMLNRGGHD